MKNNCDSLNTPVNKEPVVTRVINRIKKALMEGDLLPGDYLPTETDLTKSLGVSKTSIREAIKMLQAIGIVDVRRGDGTKISEKLNGNVLDPMIFRLIIESDQVKDLFDFRVMFEPACTVMAMERATPDDIFAIKKSVDQFEKAIRLGQQTLEDDTAFHKAMLKATHNPLVIRVGETILELFSNSIEYTVNHKPDVALRNHQRIFDALCEKNPKKLEEAVIKSFDVWKQSLELVQQEKKQKSRNQD